MNSLTLADYVHKVQSLIHDSTNSGWSRAEIIRRINDARKDVSLDCQCVRRLKTGVQLIKGVETYSYDGAVAGAHVVNRGQNYGERRATVTFTPAPPGGITAEAVAHVRQHHHSGHLSHLDEDMPQMVDGQWDGGLDNDHDDDDEHRIEPGQIELIRMTRWGKGYTQPPVITITDPAGTGSGATATPVTMLDTINIMSISPLWNTLLYSLSFKPFTIFQAWARSLRHQGFRSHPGIYTIHQGDQLVYVQPTPVQLFFSEWDVIELAKPLAVLTDIDRDIPDPWAQSVEYKAASYLLMKMQNFGQAQYYEGKYDLRVPRIVAGAGGVRIANPYNRSMWEKMRRA
ncbi:MAG: hypothetical protein J2P16_00610 [Mycobacterium sp.]|nr:hypothetical protein [Mycobacterium sp.]